VGGERETWNGVRERVTGRGDTKGDKEGGRERVKLRLTTRR
jgi:hypothetical protein